MKKTIYLTNSFSTNMLKATNIVVFKKMSLKKTIKFLNEEKENANIISAIGHEGTAKLLSNLLGFEVPTDRKNSYFSKKSDYLLIFTFGARLPEGKVLSQKELKNYKLRIFLAYLNS